MFEHTPKRRNKLLEGLKGYSWADGKVRWCTKALKTNIINGYIKALTKDYRVIQYIGLAADETKRLERQNNKQETHKHPLVEWGWSEADCL